MSVVLLTRNETVSDQEWTSNALKNRYEIKIYSYKNLNNVVFMKSFKGNSTNIEIIKYDQAYKNFLMKACNDIGVDYPNDTDPSFKRDYYLIRDADSLYFNGYFDVSNKSRLQIKGREAWIVEMFVNKIEENRKLEIHNAEKNGLKIKSYSPLYPVYMFSENLGTWCQLNFKTSKWIRIIRPPKPKGTYLAMGTDPATSNSKMEISLF